MTYEGVKVLDTEKNLRLLQLYTDLLEGSGIDKRKAAARFGVNELIDETYFDYSVTGDLLMVFLSSSTNYYTRVGY